MKVVNIALRRILYIEAISRQETGSQEYALLLFRMTDVIISMIVRN